MRHASPVHAGPERGKSDTVMRSLLVDNYDSFTYNLFHYLARVGGREPVVVRNDDPSWHPSLLEEFDNVVISPGPGDPARSADFGISAEIIDRSPFRCWASAWGTRGSASPGERASAGRRSPGTAARRPYCTSRRACSPDCRPRSRRCATTR